MRPEQAIARVLRSDDRAPVGLAFPTGGRDIVTCAHVVNAGLRREKRNNSRPSPEIELWLDFPLGGQHGDRPIRRAKVTEWLPGDGEFDELDLALLTVEEDLPAGIGALELDFGDPSGPVQMFGPVQDRATPGHVRGVIQGQVQGERWEIDQERSGAFRIARGFSGGPVWRPETGRVVGVLQAANLDETDSDAYALGVNLLISLHSKAVRRHSGTGSRLRSILILGGVTGETDHPNYELAELQRFSYRLGSEIAKSGADLLVCSPFEDSADFHALQGYLDTESANVVHLHMPQHERTEQRFAELTSLVGRTHALRIRKWYYPGPEAEGEDGWPQAWQFCQIMALDKASAVIAVGGKPGKTASWVINYAEARRVPVVPFGFLGGAAGRALSRRDFSNAYPGIDVGQLMSRDGAEHAVHLADQMSVSRMLNAANRVRPSRVFVSRARLDGAYSGGLDDLISRHGLTPVFGERAIRADRTIEGAIEDAVLGADVFIVLWSKSYAASPYCYDELAMALDRYNSGRARLWIVNLDGSPIVPPGARNLPQILARTPIAVYSAIEDLLLEVQ